MLRLRINWAVLVFFIFYFFVLQFVNDWQYRRYLDGGDSWATFKYRLASTPFSMLFYYLFYLWGVPFLFKKKFGAFLLSIILFIVLLEVCSPLEDWIATLLSRPGALVKYPASAGKTIHFCINRSILPSSIFLLLPVLLIFLTCLRKRK